MLIQFSLTNYRNFKNTAVLDLSGPAVKVHINRTPHTFTCTRINNLLLLQFKNTHRNPPIPSDRLLLVTLYEMQINFLT